jgi:hypothetical protein
MTGAFNTLEFWNKDTMDGSSLPVVATGANNITFTSSNLYPPGPIASSLLSLPLPWDTVPPSWQFFIPGKSPMSEMSSVITTIVIYLTTILVIYHIMRERAPAKISGPLKVHSAAVCIGSVILLGLMWEEMFKIVYEHGLRESICNPEVFTQVRCPYHTYPSVPMLIPTAAYAVLSHDQPYLQVHRIH